MSTDTFLSWYTVIDSFLPLSFWVSVIVPLRSEVVGFSLTVAEFVPALIQDTSRYCCGRFRCRWCM